MALGTRIVRYFFYSEVPGSLRLDPNLVFRFRSVPPVFTVLQVARFAMWEHVVYPVALLSDEGGHPLCCLIPHIHTITTYVIPANGRGRLSGM